MTESSDGRIPLSNSHLLPIPGFEPDISSTDEEYELTVTIWLRRRPDAPSLPDIGKKTSKSRSPFISREDFAKTYGADQADFATVIDFASAHGLRVLDPEAENSIARRSAMVKGSIKNLNVAFGVKIQSYKLLGNTCDGSSVPYYGYSGEIYIPMYLQEFVEGVFGLDTRSIGEPQVRFRPSEGANVLTPPQIAKSYNFPNTTAGGQTIGLLEFGGGYFATDIDAYFQDLSLPRPGIIEVQIDNAKNSPGTNERYDKEVTLDIDVAGSVAPGSTLAVYFAPHTERGWIDAISMAVHDSVNRPSILSISWGAPELQSSNTLIWTRSGMNAIHELLLDAQCLGVTVLAASGDLGSWCGVSDLRAHVLFPASDPGTTACGGTESQDLTQFPNNERTWRFTGGGISEIFDLPTWQHGNTIDVPLSVNTGANNRGMPDISGYAAPGCRFIYKLGACGRQDYIASGTSVTTPLYAGLIALINAEIGAVGCINLDLYNLVGSPVFKDIADSTWNTVGGAPGYFSHSGWDACTGLGVVDGCALLEALSGSA
jgi:subtilase family serine protease